MNTVAGNPIKIGIGETINPGDIGIVLHGDGSFEILYPGDGLQRVLDTLGIKYKDVQAAVRLELKIEQAEFVQRLRKIYDHGDDSENLGNFLNTICGAGFRIGRDTLSNEILTLVNSTLKDEQMGV